MNTFKVLLVGIGGVGKTTYLSRLKGSGFEQQYLPTIGVEVHPVKVNEHTCMNMWDIAGQEKYGGLYPGYYTGAQAAIVMLDLTRPKLSVSTCMEYVEDIKKICGDIPIILVYNKADCEYKKPDLLPIESFYLSVKDNIDLEGPLKYLVSVIGSQ
jgi:GTP-binding nuclear protein Ran